MSLNAHLNALEATGLVQLACSQPDLEYLFRHALVQDAAYESLVKADRQTLHRLAAETLQRLFPDLLSELAPQLGLHFAEAGDDLRALKYLTPAGDDALGAFANAEAVEHYRRALAIAGARRTDRARSTRRLRLNSATCTCAAAGRWN